MLDNTNNETPKFRTGKWVEVNDFLILQITENAIQINKSNSMARCGSQVSMTIVITGARAQRSGKKDKQVTFKKCVPFANCISQMNNTQVDNSEYLDIVISMYNLIEYSNNYAKISRGLLQYHIDIPNDFIANSESFKLKTKITGRTPADGNTKNVEVVLLKYLSNIWRTFEMPFTNCEINLQLTWSANCVITNSTSEGLFTIMNTRVYVPVITVDSRGYKTTTTIEFRIQKNK